MDELVSMVQSPAWWISTVVVGFMLEVAAPSVAKKLGAMAAYLSSAWANRSERSRQKNELEVRRLVNYPEALQMAMHKETRARQDVMLWIVLLASTAFAFLLIRKFVPLPKPLMLIYAYSTGILAIAQYANSRIIAARINEAAYRVAHARWTAEVEAHNASHNEPLP